MADRDDRRNTGQSTHERKINLARDLPEYMIPSKFVRLDKIPLNANGKLDRQALPEASTDSRMLQGDYVAPQDAIEIQLTTIWKELLGLSSLGREDDFFELGGHSLIAARLFAEIEIKFNIRLPLATLFEAATISQLAAILRNRSVPSWSSGKYSAIQNFLEAW